MDAIEALQTRRSIRKYEDKPVPRELLEQIIDCARLAASGNNTQPWEFVVVTDASDCRKLADMIPYGKHIATAGACVAVFCRDTRFYIEDGSAATQNLLVATRALGLGSCWIGGDKTAYAQAVAEFLAVPAGYKLVSLVTVGYPAEAPQPEKRPMPEMLHWGRFGTH